MQRWSALAGLAALGLALTAQAQQKPATPPAEQSAQAQDATPGKSNTITSKPGAGFGANQLVGQITSLDTDAKTIAIDQAGQTLELKLPENATVFVNGRLGSFTDLREGQQVRAAFEERQGQKSLRWIEVKPEKETRTPPDKSKTSGQKK